MMTNPSRHFGKITPRHTNRALRSMIMGSAGAAALLGATSAIAGSLEIEPATVKGMVVKGLRGEIEVVIGQGSEVEVVIDGDDEALDRVDTSVEKDALWITIPNDSTNIASVDGNVTVITSGGGTSHVQIGNQSFTNSSEPVELSMTATVPKGTILRLEGFVGDAEIGDTGADVVLHCAGCNAEIGEIAALDVSLTGSGNVTAKRIDRALAAKISGNGSIEIQDGSLDQATLTITGSGDIDFGGRTVDADVKIVGSGDVRLREVDNPIRSTIVGAGDIVTGE